MKKHILFIGLALCGVVSNVNAEEITEVAPEQVITQEAPMPIPDVIPDNLLESSETLTQDAIHVDPMVSVDTIYVYNPADIEYSYGMLASKYNYKQVVEEKGLRKWKVEGYIGNDTEPATFWSANREGLGFEAFAMMYDFDGHTIPGVGGGITYLRKWVGFYADAALGFNADEARTSERYGKKFTQLHASAGILSPALETKIRFTKKASPSILSFRVGAGINFKKCKDLKSDAGTYVTTEETETEYIITTVKTEGNLDAKPHVWGFEVLGRAQLDFGGSPLYLFGTASYGKSQNFTYSETQWHNAFKVKVGLGIRLFNGHSYNKDNLRRAGYTEKEVKHWNW